MKILVTGGAGFIGSNVVDTYINEGHNVVIIDNLSSGNINNINPKAKFYLLDIRSDVIEKVFDLERPDVVNHHAAQKSIPESVEMPALDADINIIGLINILNNCVKYNVKKIIFISTGGALYGNAKVVPTKESCEPNMISPYAISKFASEKYLYFYHWLYGLKYTVLRLANIYGPRQVPEGECGVTPIFINNLIIKIPSKLFASKDMPRGTTRDYIYVEDVCRANVLALVKGDNDIFNIGSGKETYTEDLYNILQKITNSYIPLIREMERPGDVKHSALDYSHAKEELGWEPRITLEEGLNKTYDFYKSFNC